MPMNHVAEEIMSYYGIGDDVSASLLHYGTPRHSGRYPWGSGDDPYQHDSRDFLGRIEEMKRSGWKETAENIKKDLGLSTTQYRTEIAIAKHERKQLQISRAKSLKEDGLSPTEIGRKMNVSESTVRGWFDSNVENNIAQSRNTADFIKKRIDEEPFGMVEVGKGVEKELNISKERLDQSLYLLERDGYKVYQARVEQQTNKGNFTTVTVACKPETEYKQVYEFDKIQPLNKDQYISKDNGQTFDKYEYPKSISSSRVKILLKDEVGPDGETGEQKDGLIQIRRGVEDLSLGNDRYAQVRILVDDNKYLKGMAVYSDDLPEGVDILVNSNKATVEKGYKSIGPDPDNPFGALIKAGGQSYYIDKNGERQLSAINKVRGEGDWSEWKDKLPSQFLSKQSKHLAKRQLGLAIEDKQAELDDILAINNPTIKKHLLQKFSDECDSAAVDLQAAALPGQKYHVIVPINSIKDNEIYAPGYENGTKLALIRYPHAGTFEIPILTVNNKQPTAKKILGTDSLDAVAINKKNADILSGADFDGDTVMCIPTHDSAGKVKIINQKPLKGLEGFDPRAAYPEVPGMRIMSEHVKQKEMGVVSNLICDMTLQGATSDELARAVRHSMVVIDAAKHRLNYKLSEQENGIKALKKKYQAGGAFTLISKAKGEEAVPKRQGSPKINQKGKPWYDPDKPEGSYIYKTADDKELYYPVLRDKDSARGLFKKGDPVLEKDGTPRMAMRMTKSTRMAEADDAFDLVSPARTPMELIYADYANTMKGMANKARMTMVNTGKIEYSKTAKVTYAAEVESLNAKLRFAELNAPKERIAQLRTAAAIKQKKEENPDMSKSDIKKAKQQALTRNRSDVGVISRRDRNIVLTDREWEAIQAGAVSEQTLKRILNNADIEDLRARATPRTSKLMSPAKITRTKNLSAKGYSIAEIAKKMGVSTTTVSMYLKGEK